MSRDSKMSIISSEFYDMYSPTVAGVIYATASDFLEISDCLFSKC